MRKSGGGVRNWN